MDNTSRKHGLKY